MVKALTKTVVEPTSDEEMADHLGYDRHDPGAWSNALYRRAITVRVSNDGSRH